MTRPTPGRIDPSRTITLRRELSTIVSRQFARLRYDLMQLVVEEDAFGLRRRPQMTPDYVFNVYCPTGEGGGIDPTCSPDGSGGGDVSSSVPASKPVVKEPTIPGLKKLFASLGADEVSTKTGESSVRSGKLQIGTVTADSKGFKFKKSLLGGIDVSWRTGGSFSASATDKAVRDSAAAESKLREMGYVIHRYNETGFIVKIPKPFVKNEMTDNAFCPTGEGGGVDPTCSPKDGGGGSESVRLRFTKEGGNKVTNPNGEPIKVFHGSSVEFDEFKDGVTYFSPSPGYGYVWKSPHVVEAEVRITNPYRTEHLTDVEGAAYQPDWVAELKSKGYDGIIYSKKDNLLKGPSGWGDDHPQYVVFSKDQIRTKSRYQNEEFQRGIQSGEITTNAEPGRFAFASSETKVKEFGKWIEQQYKIRVTSDEQDQVWRKFIERSYKKGTGRAYDDYMKGRKEQGIDDKKKMDFYAGSKEEFLRSSFANPERIDKLKLLAARTFMDLEGATKESATKIRRALVEGLAQGKGPREIARRMSEELGVAKWRALRIARTEIVRAHAEGQLNALEKLGVKNVGAKVEWGITKTKDGRPDPRVCEKCLDMDGVVFTIKEARGRIPAHPNCRCAWLPVIEEAKKPKLSKKRPKPKPKKAPPPAPARKRPTKDDRPDELDRLEITFGKKKIAIIRDPRAPAKPKGKARPKRKPPKKRSPAPKSKKAAIRKSGKKTKPKPTSTTRRGAKKTVRKKATTPKRPVARSRQKAGPTAKKRPTRNELYPELIQFSRVIGNVFCPTGEGGGVDPTRNEESS